MYEMTRIVSPLRQRRGMISGGLVVIELNDQLLKYTELQPACGFPQEFLHTGEEKLTFPQEFLTTHEEFLTDRKVKNAGSRMNHGLQRCG